MAVLFNKIERSIPTNHSAPKKWYPVLKTMSRIMEREVAKEMTEESTLNRKEAELALGLLEKVIIRNLRASNSVQIGDWGTFYLTCKSTPSETKEEITANNICGLRTRFTPGKSMKNALLGVSFLDTETLVTKSEQ